MAEETGKKSKPKKNHFVTFIEASIIFSICLAIVSLEVPRFGPSRRRTYQQRCFNNQRILTGSIEMYNMDHEDMIKVYNSEVYDLLKKEKYLKGDLVDETECEFLTDGDLSVDGFIYCENHGSWNKTIAGKNVEASLTPKKDSSERQKKQIVKLLITFGPTLFYLFLRLI